MSENRVDRLLELLEDGKPHCTRELYFSLPGYPARPKEEAIKQGHVSRDGIGSP